MNNKLIFGICCFIMFFVMIISSYFSLYVDLDNFIHLSLLVILNIFCYVLVVFVFLSLYVIFGGSE